MFDPNKPVDRQDVDEVNEDCYHQCSGKCRRDGCNCYCGEYHEEPAEVDNV